MNNTRTAFLLLSLLFLMLSFPSAALAYTKTDGWCERGGVAVVIPGTQGSGNQRFQQSYRSCTVTVYESGTLTLATLYADSTGTTKANPFTADTSGYWFFFGTSDIYDVRFSNGGITSPFTDSDVNGVIPFPRPAVTIVPSLNSANWTVFDINGDVLERSNVVASVQASANTAAGSNVLTFASTAGLGIEVGMGIFNRESPISIPDGATVTAVTATTVIMSGVAVSPGVTATDLIKFISNPTWINDAVEYAMDRGYPIIAMGQAGRNTDDTVGPAQLIVTNGPINFTECIFPYVDFSSVSMDIVGSDGIVFDSCEYGTFKMPNPLTYHGNGAVVHWNPVNQTPVDHLVGFSGNVWEFSTAVVQGGADTANVFQISLGGSFSENTIRFKELFGGRRTLEGGGFINDVFIVDNPGASTMFRRNLIEGTHIHGCGATCIRVGNGSNSDNLNNNIWTITSINPSAVAAIGISTYGDSDTIVAAVDQDSGGVTYANSVVLQASAVSNRILVNDASSSSGLSNLGSSNSIYRNGGVTLPALGIEAAAAGNMLRFAGVAFASLGAPSNGSFTYCTDCSKATPCAGGGSGALAKRLNGAWDCD